MSSFSTAPFGRQNQNKEPMAMSLFELDAPRSLNSNGFLSKVAAWPAQVIRSMQYGRMMQALAALSDTQLAAIGLTRSEIPRYARECLEEKNV